MITPETDLVGKHFHMLGVGGMGMAPLSIFLKQAGCRITGDDDNFHPRLHQLLLSHGIEISHKPDLKSVDGVVYSNALGAAHPSLREAVAAKIPTMRRGEFLAALSKRYRTIAVAGSHGKTTTCGMLIYAFQQIGFPCNSILGGLFAKDQLPPAQYNERSPWLVIEVDESDGSIKAFNPAISLIVNVDWDHADFYTSKKKCIKTFQGIVNRTSGTVFLNHSCENSRKLKLKKTSAIVYSFGKGGEAQLLEFKTNQMQLGGTLPPTSIGVPFDERFNAENALAALSV
ncbi:MAG: hypothetical protein KJT03_18915, partial [Verrucomicrobiae bacterium]|nr:hypothetical protein [Verrucomicrobiae bacterium]